MVRSAFRRTAWFAPPHGLPSTPNGRLVFAATTLVGGILIAWFTILDANGRGYDAFAYWDVRLDDVYGRSFGHQLTAFGAFRYAPPLAFLFAPLHAIPWPIFLAAWTAVLTGALVWLTRWWALAACAFIGIPMSLYQGNVDLIIAASIVAGFRWPMAWSFAILAKGTPVIGLLWYVARREWVGLRVAIAGIIIVSIPSLVVAPELWRDYLRVLADNSSTGDAESLLARVVVGVGLVLWAARSNRPWLVASAIALVQPSLGLRSAAVAVAALALALRAARSPGLAHEPKPVQLGPQPLVP